jgi:hypothetical protein
MEGEVAFINSLIRYATWRNTIILLLAQFVVQGLILLWAYPQLGDQGVPLDMRSGLTVPALREYLTSIGPHGRKLYALNELTLDLLFPLLYSCAYSFLFLRLIIPMTGNASRWRLIGLLPFVIAAADICENVSIVGAAASYASPGAWAGAVVFFNMIKGSVMMTTLVALVLVICVRLAFFFMKRRRTT